MRASDRPDWALSARARKSRLSTMCDSRTYSSMLEPITFWYSSGVLVRDRAMSASTIRLLIGVRSSWARLPV